MRASTGRGRAGRKRTHGPRTSVSFRLPAEVLEALRFGAVRRGLTRLDLFCQTMATRVGVPYPTPARLALVEVAYAPPLDAGQGAPGPTMFPVPDDMLERLRQVVEQLDYKSLTALVIDALEEALAEELAVVRSHRELLVGGSPLAKAS